MTRIASKFVRAGSFNTHYLEAGREGAPTMVLLHDGSFGSTAELCWSALIAELADDFHILAPDLLGWGQTDKAVFLDRSPYAGRLPHLADFAAALGFERAVYVGSSFGGSLTLRGALEAGNPLRIAAGISIAGTGGPYRRPEGIAAMASYRPEIDEARRLTRLFIGHLDGMEAQAEGRLAASLAPGQWECMMAAQLKSPAASPPAGGDDYLQRLAATPVPLMLIEGLRDPLLETGWAARMAALSAAIEGVALDVGHQPNIVIAPQVAGLIRDFARKHGCLA